MAAGRKVIVVGGGLSGLACAGRLAGRGLSPLVLEASDVVGGRVRTDALEGFLLDRGFQVFLDAYPVAGSLLDLSALKLGRFRPGALVYRGGRRHRLMDVFREPWGLPAAALQPIGSLKDKLLVAKLRWEILRGGGGVGQGGIDTAERLRRYGFSEGMIDGFFRPFYGGIFLERELSTPAWMFDFTFGMFARGHACLPAGGMGEIPRQLAARLPQGAVRTGARVGQVDPGGVTLEDGERLEADAVVVAADAGSAGPLVSGGDGEVGWRSVACVYFSAPRSPLRGEPIIALNGEEGVVSNVSVPSDVVSGYAPPGRSLVSVSVLGKPEAGGLEGRVREELAGWFGVEVGAWEHLRSYQIDRALPVLSGAGAGVGFGREGGVYRCGDYLASASIEGALGSGSKVADVVGDDLSGGGAAS